MPKYLDPHIPSGEQQIEDMLSDTIADPTLESPEGRKHLPDKIEV